MLTQVSSTLASRHQSCTQNKVIFHLFPWSTSVAPWPALESCKRVNSHAMHTQIPPQVTDVTRVAVCSMTGCHKKINNHSNWLMRNSYITANWSMHKSHATANEDPRGRWRPAIDRSDWPYQHTHDPNHWNPLINWHLSITSSINQPTTWTSKKTWMEL